MWYMSELWLSWLDTAELIRIHHRWHWDYVGKFFFVAWTHRARAMKAVPFCCQVKFSPGVWAQAANMTWGSWAASSVLVSLYVWVFFFFDSVQLDRVLPKKSGGTCWEEGKAPLLLPCWEEGNFFSNWGCFVPAVIHLCLGFFIMSHFYGLREQLRLERIWKDHLVQPFVVKVA